YIILANRAHPVPRAGELRESNASAVSAGGGGGGGGGGGALGDWRTRRLRLFAFSAWSSNVLVRAVVGAVPRAN
ncbi:hypothetical protein HDU82_004111, partial [Entophlyctis luteolus]